MSPSLDDLPPMEPPTPEEEYRREMHRRLDDLLDLMPRYSEDAALRDRVGMARLLLVSAARFAGFVCGETIVAHAYSRGEAAPDELDALSHRITTASALFGRFDRLDDPSSLTSAATEIRAIINGDVPRLLRQRNPNKKIDHRLNLQRLRAFEWDAHLEFRDMPAFSRHGVIGDAYETDWPTMLKWKPRILVRTLGKGRVDRALEQARSEYWLMSARPDISWQEALKDDGRRYVDEFNKVKAKGEI